MPSNIKLLPPWQLEHITRRIWKVSSSLHLDPSGRPWHTFLFNYRILFHKNSHQGIRQQCQTHCSHSRLVFVLCCSPFADGDHVTQCWYESLPESNLSMTSSHLLGGVVIHAQSVMADGGCQPVMAMVPCFTTKQWVFYPSYQLFRRWELWLTICATRSRYILLRYGSNFEENEHKQVTVYREASTFLLSPYLFFFPPFISFTHHNTSYCHSIQFNQSCF